MYIDYPKVMTGADGTTVIAADAADEKVKTKLGYKAFVGDPTVYEETPVGYVPTDYPKIMDGVLVNNEDEELALLDKVK